MRYEGRPALGGPNLTIVLHALVLGRGKVFREDLISLLAQHERGAERQDSALRNALTKLRGHSLEIPPGQNPVVMNVAQPAARIDLWEFFTHVRFGRYAEAHALIAEGQEPHLLPGAEDPDHPAWRATLAAFEEARAETLAALRAATRRQRSVRATRERLLARSLVPGVGRQVPIRDLRERVEALPVPWRQERPRPGRIATPLPGHLAGLLGEEAVAPRQVVVVGGVGAGKTLTAISTFLRLTDDGVEGAARPVLYLDAGEEADEGGLEERLREAREEGSGRPILIVPHGDSLLAGERDLAAALDRRLLREHDVLLCCGAPLYSQRLSYEEFGTHVVHLEPWDHSLQRQFALALAGEQKTSQFVKWVEEDRSRRRLCSVPLHLVHVLALLGEGSGELAEVSTAPQLMEGVARMRLRVTRPPFDGDQLMEDLGSVAHRFYLDAASPDRGIRFTAEELRLHLAAAKRKRVRRRVETLTNETFLAARPGSAQIGFEQPSWGRFFAARHIVQTAIYRPEATRQALSKLLSADLMRLCEQMLRDRLPRYSIEIHAALRGALLDRGRERRAADRSTVARGQAGYLLGALADRRLRRELAQLTEAGSPRREKDPLVCRALLLGLASNGAAGCADAYVDSLRAERHAGGESPERDANLAFTLSLCGDRAFDPERLARIQLGADPTRSVGGLARRLEEPRGSGAWRILLFTLVDLARHPRISSERFACALQPHRAQLGALLAALEADPRRQHWPELAELRGLLAAGGEAADQAATGAGPAQTSAR